MRPLPALVCVTCLLVVLALPVAAGPTIASGEPAPVDRSADPSIAHQVDDNATNGSNRTAPIENATQTIQIDVLDDGSARVSIVWRYPTGSDDERAAIDRLASDFERGQLDSAWSLDVFERVVAEVDRSTNRTHAIENESRSTSIDNESGELQLSFTWIGFARAENEELHVDDAFLVEGGTWLPALRSDQRLVINAPIGYAVDRSPAVEVIDGSAQWEGPTTFEPGEIEFVYVPRDPSPLPNGDTGGGDGDPVVGQYSPLTILLAVALFGTLLLLGALLLRRGNRGPLRRAPTDGADTVTAARSDGDGGGAEVESIDSRDEPSDPPAGSDDPFADIDPELLSDEERVVRLLKANGNRMKQATIVKETRWSNAKVSQLLSSMAEEGTIEKLRIGRENLITLIDTDGDETGDAASR